MLTEQPEFTPSQDDLLFTDLINIIEGVEESSFVHALLQGIPDDEDEQKTGWINLMFNSDCKVATKTFVARCQEERCNWIFKPAQIRARLAAIHEYGLEKM
jgi:hypothetical protein